MDITQDSLLIAWRRLHQLEDRNACLPWLYRIARNSYYSEHRRARVRRCLSLDWLMALPNSTDVEVDRDASPDRWHEDDIVRLAFGQMSPLAQESLYLHHVAGYTGKEIASILGISHSAAKQRIHRAQRDFEHRYAVLQIEVAPAGTCDANLKTQGIG